MNDPVIAVIPARYASTRFPGKALAELCGKPMIQHVYEKAQASRADLVVVATDHELIKTKVESFGGRAVMTSPDHPSGTDRIFEAIQGLPGDIVINLQGDEPLLPTSVIDALIELMQNRPDCPMATVAVPAPRARLADSNIVKVVRGADGQALYFSRAPIPFLRDGGTEMPLYQHWGIYAYRRRTLARFVALPPSPLENCEKLEQLRALENGIPIQVLLSRLSSIGVDTPADLAAAEALMKQQRLEANR